AAEQQPRETGASVRTDDEQRDLLALDRLQHLLARIAGEEPAFDAEAGAAQTVLCAVDQRLMPHAFLLEGAHRLGGGGGVRRGGPGDAAARPPRPPQARGP